MKYSKKDPTHGEIIAITTGCVVGLVLQGVLKTETAEEVLLALGEEGGLAGFLQDLAASPDFKKLRGNAQ
jgi:hypothetical protein